MFFKSAFRACALVLLTSAAAFAQTRDEDIARCGDNDPDAAVAACTRLIEAGKETPADLATAYNHRGSAYMDRGNLGSAADDFEQATKLDPRFATSLIMIANLYRASGDEVGALHYLDEGLRLNPSAALFASRGSLYVAIGDYRSAIADYDRAVTLEPNSANHLTNRCVALFRGNKAQAAVEDCTRSLGLRPGHAATLDSRAYAYLKLGDFPRAIADCSAALAISPERVSSLYARGLAKRKTGDEAGAKTDIAAAEAILPDIANRMARVGVEP